MNSYRLPFVLTSGGRMLGQECSYCGGQALGRRCCALCGRWPLCGRCLEAHECEEEEDIFSPGQEP